MTTWTREHDAVIARECEGLTVEFDGGRGLRVVIKSVFSQPVAYYNINLSAIARAGEAWRTKNEDIDRTIQVNSPVERMGLPFRVECSENYRVGENYEWRTFKGEAEDETLARAWALYNAVKGTK